MHTGGEWDAKHRARRAETAGEPDEFVRAALDRLAAERARERGASPGVAWDLACGRGRHALELARRGFAVTAFDRSPEALAQVAEHAARAGLAVDTACADLADPGWWAERARPDLIVVVNYLDRALLDALPERLAPNGALLVTTFTVDHPGEHPSARFRLERGELEDRFGDRADVRLARESGGRAGLLARIRASSVNAGD